MKVVVGLGNPGRQYAGTRHNVGFEVVTELVRRWQAGQPQIKFQSEIHEAVSGNEKVLLVAPQTFMNRSGEAVQQLAGFYKIPAENIAVICDDMNLPSGALRWRGCGSAGGQKGLADIILRLGTDNVPRLRLGIGRPPGQMDAVNWVLSRFSESESSDMELMIQRAADSVAEWVSLGLVSAMNRFNGLAGAD